MLLMSFILFVVACSSNENDDEVVKEKDTIAPTIVCMDPIRFIAKPNENKAKVIYDTPVGMDNVAGAKTKQTEGLASGELFPLGTTTNTFVVTDIEGNQSSCSFDVVVTQASLTGTEPYFFGEDPTPKGKKWVKSENKSDEFNNNIFDNTKWHKNPATDGFGWYGRPPALFDPQNVTVSDGNLNVTTLKYNTPKNVNNTSWTHGGGIVRSKETVSVGQYFECKMKANKTVMSSTFWLSFKQNCSTGPFRKLELDVQECVGRVHSGTANWAKDFDNIYHSNTWRHNRPCDTAIDASKQSPSKKILSEKNNSRYFVYGCWWKSPNEILFYLDGAYVYSITNPPAEFDLEGHLTMAIETYDWNPIDANNIFETASYDELTTKYDWIRTWSLKDE